jgi:hypothetical protein
MSFFFGVNRRRLSSLRGFVVCGALAMGSVLAAPLGARALDFDWYFVDQNGDTTRATIKGLVEGYNPGGAGEVVEVVETPLTLALGGDWAFQRTASLPYAFYIQDGQVLAADALYARSGGQVGFGAYYPGAPAPVPSGGIYCNQISDTTAVETLYNCNGIFNPDPSQAAFVSTTAAPAPLPILGVGMALGYGRRLRSRVRAARGCFGVEPIV